MKIGVIQLTSQLEPDKNLEKIRGFLHQAKDEGAIAVFLPEVFYSMSDAKTPTPYLVEEGNEHFAKIRSLATDSGLYLLGGTAASNLGGKVINRSYNFDPSGELIGHYDKIHLFSCDLSKHKSRTIIDEGDVYTAGSEMKIIEWEGWKMGMSICFDLRFPEMFREYYRQGANLFTVSSAFTIPTGKAHWETLLRARAIENQSYVVAAAQYGEHNEQIKTYGHSMVINPWGEVIANAKEGEKIIFADLDIEQVTTFRERLSVPVDSY
jgi:predicted amidohydrolase